MIGTDELSQRKDESKKEMGTVKNFEEFCHVMVGQHSVRN